MIEIKKIRAVSDSRAYTRGKQLFQSGGIQDMSIRREKDMVYILAQVEGNVEDSYEVRLTYSLKQDRFAACHCECQAFYTYSGLCKHCVAAALAFYYEDTAPENKEKGAYIPPTDEILSQVMYSNSMQEKARYFQPEITGRVELLPVLKMKSGEWYAEFRIGISHKYVVKNITDLVMGVRDYAYIEYGKKLAFYHERGAFTPKSQELLNFLEEYVQESQSAMSNYYRQSSYYSYYDSDVSDVVKREILLTDIWMVKLAGILAGGSCSLEAPQMKEKMEFLSEEPRLSVKLKETQAGGYQLEMPAAEIFTGQKSCCIRVGSTMYVCSREFAQNLGEAARLFQGGRKRTYGIHPADAAVFCSSILPALEKCTDCTVPPKLEMQRPHPLEIRIYLDYMGGAVTGKFLFCYGETEYNLMDEITVRDMHRDFEKEKEAVRIAREYFQDSDAQQKVLLLDEDEEERLYGLLESGIPQMQEIGQVYVSESFKKIQTVRTPQVRIGVAMKTGLLDIELEGERFSEEELDGILSACKKKRKFYRLADGTFLSLQENGLSAVAEMAEGLELKGKDLVSGHVSVPAYRAFYLDRILQENSGQMEAQRDQAFKALLRDMKNVEDSDFEVPEGLHASLRPYQAFGFRWMMTLSKLGFGGILADDMGLGKTVQAIAYLAGRREGVDSYAALIVCPASLVYNWEAELVRFAPELPVMTIAGNAAERREMIRSGRDGVRITSYDLLKRDIEAYEGLVFDDMIIDEAQNIKNYSTQSARAVRAVNSRHRFALTGTPIENSLSELWSIFDFLMPGILSSNKKFRENYEQPIVNSQDEAVSGRLKKMIRPFILRRTKREVLKELPDKLEKVIYSVMEGRQKELYRASVQRLKDSLEKQTEEEFKTGRLQILAELTRLRQICCDPSMAFEDFKGEAAKTEACIELIRTAAAAGNKVLLFSQFTSALEIIRKRLEGENIESFLLTGSTPKEKRIWMAERFNRDKTPVFLISLKAGGTGLNLTAASIVIHFDPWWNMAAQNQATDRAHRIGQKQVVTVYKLIMKNTLEEKILKLQERKAQLSDEIISEGRIQNTLASREELLEILRSPL